MEFQNRVLTERGQELIAQASSANKIIFLRALSSTVYMDNETLVDINPSNLTGPEGAIKTTSATNSVARIIAEYTNQPEATTIKTVAIVARLSTQSDEDAIVVMAQSDPTASIWIPSTSDLHVSIQVTFNLKIGNDSNVSVNAAANVSLGDHERLMERTVTTHTDGDADEGEDQNILGKKSFADDAIFKKEAYFNTIKPLKTYCIVITWLNADHTDAVNSLCSILDITESEAETLYQAIVYGIGMYARYVISVPSYNITNANVDDKATQLNNAGFQCTKESTINDIGSAEAPFNTGHFDYISATGGIAIKDDSRQYKRIVIGTTSVNSDCCIRAKQNDLTENCIEMRVMTQGGDFGPYIRANVDRTDAKYVSSIYLNAQKYFSDAGDYGPTLLLKNDVSGGLNSGTVEMTASHFKITHKAPNVSETFFEVASDGTLNFGKAIVKGDVICGTNTIGQYTSGNLGDISHYWNCIYTAYGNIKNGINIQGRIASQYMFPGTWDSTNSEDGSNIIVKRSAANGATFAAPLGSLDSSFPIDNTSLSSKSITQAVSMPIGGLIYAFPSSLWITNNAGRTFKAGDTITVNTDTTGQDNGRWFLSKIKTNESTGNTEHIELSQYLPTGTYRAFETIEIVANQQRQFETPILLQRIS